MDGVGELERAFVAEAVDLVQRPERVFCDGLESVFFIGGFEQGDLPFGQAVFDEFEIVVVVAGKAGDAVGNDLDLFSGKRGIWDRMCGSLRIFSRQSSPKVS